MTCLVVVAGCSKPQQSTTTTYGTIGWNSPEVEKNVPGIDQAVLNWYLRDQQLTYIVWTDMNGGSGYSSGSGGSSSAGIEKHQSSMESSDRQQFEFEYTRDKNQDQNNNGTVTIAGVQYDLGNGAILLVTTHGKSVQVKQLAIDQAISDLVCNKDLTPESLRTALKSTAKNQDEFKLFFSGVQ